MFSSEKRAAEDEELATMPSQTGGVQDPVFGAAHEDGPNYRSVGLPLHSKPSGTKLTFSLGGLASSFSPVDENRSRHWCVVDSTSLRQSRNDSWDSRSTSHRFYHDLVCLCRWLLQIEPSTSLRHRGRRFLTVWTCRSGTIIGGFLSS